MRIRDRITLVGCVLLVAQVAALAEEAPYMVRLGYLIPPNRSPQVAGATAFADQMLTLQAWYRDQMDRSGFGPKSFTLETDATGQPLVHVIDTRFTDAEIRDSTWSRARDAVAEAGFSIWSPGTAWVLIPESHLQTPNSSIDGGFAGGAHIAPGGGSGVAVVGGDMLVRSGTANLLDSTRYEGLVMPEIGPYPLVQDVSFPWFERDTVSSVSSAAQGAIAHELGHAFGLPHDFRNDDNYFGNLMGNGLRGLRGALRPDLFPNDDVFLSMGSAMLLNASRFFNPDQTFAENEQPHLEILTQGEVAPADGKLAIDFAASDPSGLSVAVLIRGGNAVDQMLLSGTSVATAFETPFYEPGQTEEFRIDVYDAQGNRRFVTQSITPTTGSNQAPQPFVRLSSSQVLVGEQVTLDAARTKDDTGQGDLRVQWDTNGDGIYETEPSATLAWPTRFDSAGVRRIQARVSDSDGAFSISSPVSLRVLMLGDFNLNEMLDVADIDALALAIRNQSSDARFDVDADGAIGESDRLFWVKDLADTSLGDANLDGTFNSDDLIDVFAAGQYHDDIPQNSMWGSGDWDGDADFTPDDLITAFADGGYETALPTIRAVPEPNGLLQVGCLTLILGLTTARQRVVQRSATGERVPAGRWAQTSGNRSVASPKWSSVTPILSIKLR